MEFEFVECAECKSRPGSPMLCVSCLHNRRVIEALLDGYKHSGTAPGGVIPKRDSDQRQIANHPGISQPEIPREVVVAMRILGMNHTRKMAELGTCEHGKRGLNHGAACYSNSASELDALCDKIEQEMTRDVRAA